MSIFTGEANFSRLLPRTLLFEATYCPPPLKAPVFKHGEESGVPCLGLGHRGTPSLDNGSSFCDNTHMRKMYEYRIYPTKKQQTKLNETLEECRWLYNHLLAKRKETYEQTGKSLTLYQQVEDLRVNRMTHNHCLAKSIHDASWSEFLSKLSCKAEEAGRKYVAVNPAYTSQDCSRCHHRQVMPLSERTYHCPCCLLAIDRDLNAAKNILAVGLHSLGLSLEAPAFMRGE